MRDSTSGLMLTENKDGSIRVEVVDYNVSEYDGGDIEMWYEIDAENAEKLKNALKDKHSGDFEEMLIAEFGKTFDMPDFQKFCNENGVKYRFQTWTSF